MAAIVCPICKAQSEEIEPGTPDVIVIRCLTHKDFKVSRTVLAEERERDAAQWETAFSKAKQRAAPEERPKILSYDFDD